MIDLEKFKEALDKDLAVKNQINMKTPIQELLAYTADLLHTFDSEERVAMAVLDYLKSNKDAILEKEKEVIEDIIDIIDSENSGQSAEQRLDSIKEYLLTL